MNDIREVAISATTPNESAALPIVIPSVPGFLFATLERAACAVFCKENRMKIATSPTSTGNPGQPRDLQFTPPASNAEESFPVPANELVIPRACDLMLLHLTGE
jgi:hypothetical protein